MEDEQWIKGNQIRCSWSEIQLDSYRNNWKGALSGLAQLLTTESPLKMMGNAFYFTLKALFVLKILKCLS